VEETAKALTLPMSGGMNILTYMHACTSCYTSTKTE